MTQPSVEALMQQLINAEQAKVNEELLGMVQLLTARLVAMEKALAQIALVAKKGLDLLQAQRAAAQAAGAVKH